MVVAAENRSFTIKEYKLIQSALKTQKERHAYACLSFCCAADCGACGRKLNAKGTPDGFLSHLQSFSLTKARLQLVLNK